MVTDWGWCGSSVFFEEVLEEGGAFVAEDAAVDFDGMVEFLVAEDVVDTADGACFFFPGSHDEGGNSGKEDSASAHEAGFEGDGEGAVVESPGAEVLGGLADGDDFGVGGGVSIGFAAVVADADDGAGGVGDDGADGDVVVGGSVVGLGEGLQHEVFVVGVAGAVGEGGAAVGCGVHGVSG